MENKSGVYPCGDRVLVLPDKIEKKVGMIEIPDQIVENHGMAQTIGTVVAVGPDAWTHYTENGTHGVTVRGFKGAFAKVGEKVMFAKYGGLKVRGKDDKEYRLINDIDVTAKVDPDVKATDIRSREMYGS
jgi:co-chaperonin GroES (HSP10)